MSARKGSQCAPDRACQKAPKGMRQKMRRKITTVSTTGTPRAQAVRRRATACSVAGSGMCGSHMGASVQGGDGVVECCLHRGQRQGQGGTRLMLVAPASGASGQAV